MKEVCTECLGGASGVQHSLVCRFVADERFSSSSSLLLLLFFFSSSQSSSQFKCEFKKKATAGYFCKHKSMDNKHKYQSRPISVRSERRERRERREKCVCQPSVFCYQRRKSRGKAQVQGSGRMIPRGMMCSNHHVHLHSCFGLEGLKATVSSHERLCQAKAKASRNSYCCTGSVSDLLSRVREYETKTKRIKYGTAYRRRLGGRASNSRTDSVSLPALSVS